MARLMVSAGMLSALALSTAARSLGLPLRSPPPVRAATVISLMNLVQPFDFLASEAAFLCLILLHRLWPDIARLAGAGGHCGLLPDYCRMVCRIVGRTVGESEA